MGLWQGIFQQQQAERLDQFLTKCLAALPEVAGLSRSQVQHLIRAGQVSVNGRQVLKSGYGLQTGDNLLVSWQQPPSSAELEPWELPLDIVFEDEVLAVVNKAPGVTMHPGAGNRQRTLVNALLHHWGRDWQSLNETERPGIVHRLDKDTSGLLVVAKTRAVQTALSAQFAERSIGRVYHALAFTTPRRSLSWLRAEAGTIENRIGRHPSRRTVMAVVAKGGRPARTHWRRLADYQYGVLLELKLETGRTHQIRVQLAHQGAPVIGDPLYGRAVALPLVLQQAASAFGRQALHAKSLYFIHPLSGKHLEFDSELPHAMQQLIDFFRAL